MDKENCNEFRKYLEKDGTVGKLTNALVKLYQESERPDDAVMFIRKHLCLNCSDESRVMELSKKLELMTEEKKKLDRQIMITKTSMRESNSEADLSLVLGVEALWADEACTSLLKNNLDPEVFELVKDLKSDGRGTLLDNIKSGLDNHDFSVGVFASDPDAYDCFYELYDPLLKQLHDGFSEETKHPEAIDWGNVELFEDLDKTGLFIKRIRVTCSRAIEGFSFSPKLNEKDFQEILNQIQPVLENISDEELKGTFYALDGIDPAIENNLKNDGVMFTNDDKFLISANAYRFWPVGRGVFVNKANTLQVRINEEEHLQVISVDKGANLMTCYQRLVKAMDLINDSNLIFAKDPKLGFLAFNPASLGNTIQASVLAKIPKLMQPENTEKLEGIAGANHISITNKGSGITELCSCHKIGVTEFDSVMEFQNGIKEIIIMEKCQYIKE